MPEIVLLLLYVTVMAAMALTGFASGLAGARELRTTLPMMLLITAVLFVIIDLDKPRRGVIQVSNKPFLELMQTISADDAAGVRGASVTQ